MRSEGTTLKNGESIFGFSHDNAPAHQLVLVKDFLAKNNVTTLEHHPYSFDLASADFHLFPQLKSALMGQNVLMLLT
jgi:hypothetical protein